MEEGEGSLSSSTVDEQHSSPNSLLTKPQNTLSSSEENQDSIDNPLTTKEQHEDELDFEEADDDASDAMKAQVVMNDAPEPAEISNPLSDGELEEDGEVADSDDDDSKKKDLKKPTNDEDLEDGELPDSDEEGEDKSVGESGPKDPCKFFHKGTCTWGYACRFDHSLPMHQGSLSSSSKKAVPRSEGLPPPVMSGLKPIAGFPLLPTPPCSGDPAASSWERGLKSVKERVERAKERKETELDFDDKKMNMSMTDSFGRTRPPGYEPPPTREYHRSPSPTSHRRHASSHYHYRNYPEESEYERRQRLAYMAAPEDWTDKRNDHYPRPKAESSRLPPDADVPVNPTPGLNRYGQPITVASRQENVEYVDRWRRSPNIPSRPPGTSRVSSRYDRKSFEGHDLSSISTSASDLSESDSDGSWSSNDKPKTSKTSRSNHKTKVPTEGRIGDRQPPPFGGSSSTAGMKRIPKLGERSRRDRVQEPLPPPDLFRTPSPRPRSLSHRSQSMSSHSSREMTYEDDFGRRKRSRPQTGIPEEEDNFKRSRRMSGSPVSSASSDHRSDSPTTSRKNNKFSMGFTGKSPRIQPTKAATTLDHKSSDEDDYNSRGSALSNTKSRSPPASSDANKGLERKKLLEQLKAVEAAIAAKKQPSKVSQRKK